VERLSAPFYGAIENVAFFAVFTSRKFKRVFHEFAISPSTNAILKIGLSCLLDIEKSFLLIVILFEKKGVEGKLCMPN
jgi:hypothetical protein